MNRKRGSAGMNWKKGIVWTSTEKWGRYGHEPEKGQCGHEPEKRGQYRHKPKKGGVDINRKRGCSVHKQEKGMLSA